MASARSKHKPVAEHQRGSQAMPSKEPERHSCRTAPARGPHGHPDLRDHRRGSQQWAVLPQTAPGTPLLWLAAFHVGVESRCPDEAVQGQTRPCGGKELSSEEQSTHSVGAWPGRSLPGSTPARLTRTHPSRRWPNLSLLASLMAQADCPQMAAGGVRRAGRPLHPHVSGPGPESGLTSGGRPASPPCTRAPRDPEARTASATGPRRRYQNSNLQLRTRVSCLLQPQTETLTTGCSCPRASTDHRPCGVCWGRGRRHG